MSSTQDDARELKDELFRFLNCYEIEASEISNGMTYIDSQEAEKMCRELMELITSYTEKAVADAREGEAYGAYLRIVRHPSDKTNATLLMAQETRLLELRAAIQSNKGMEE
jgi:hypothetical protein